MSKVTPEIYTELTHSLMMSVAMDQLRITQVAMLLHQCAQPKARQHEIDITMEIRDALDDWSQEDKGRIIAIEVVHIVFPCVNKHNGSDPCAKGKHTVQMTRVLGSPGGWRPENITSRHQFNEVVIRLSSAHHPEHGKDKLQLAGHLGMDTDLASAFNKVMGEQAIEQQVTNFRDELDKLFPSVPINPQEGGTGDEPA